MTRKEKSPEINRFLQLLENLGETTESLAEKTGISARTINNYIWGDNPLGGALLRALSDQFGVSVDWLLTGIGSPFANSENSAAVKQRLLLPFFETVDISTLQDFWWLSARAVEESLVESGAVPGEDYSILDLYQLAGPLVTAKFAGGELTLQAHEAAG